MKSFEYRWRCADCKVEHTYAITPRRIAEGKWKGELLCDPCAVKAYVAWMEKPNVQYPKTDWENQGVSPCKDCLYKEYAEGFITCVPTDNNEDCEAWRKWNEKAKE